MKQKYMSILVIFNILIFSIITVFSGIMLFRASYAASNNTVWDGTIGTSFAGGNGTSSSPYLISNGKQLAYFIKKCNESASYRSKYYKLTADIYLNDGYFDYRSQDEYYYYKNNTRYYINKNQYYDSESHLVGTFNQLPISNFNFTGNFDGDYYSIVGLFYYNETYTEDFGFFKNLSDSSYILELKVINSSITANANNLGFIGKSYNSSIEDFVFKGVIKNLGDYINIGYNHISGNTIYLNSNNNTGGIFELSGIASESFTYQGTDYPAGRFTIAFGSNKTSVTLESSTNLQLSEITYYFYNGYYGNTGFIGHFEKGHIDSVSVSGSIVGSYGQTGGLIGVCTRDNYNTDDYIYIYRSYNRASVYGKTRVGGVIGGINNPIGAKHTVNLTNVYNSGLIENQSVIGLDSNAFKGIGGLVGVIRYVKKINFNNCINHSSLNLDGQFIGNFKDYDSSDISSTTSYYTYSESRAIGNYSGSVSGVSYKNYLSLDYTSMRYLEKSAGSSINNIWILESNNMPYLYFDELTKPNINISINVSGTNYTWNNNSSSVLRIIYDYDDERIVNVNVTDNDEIMYVEYFIEDGLKYNTYEPEMNSYDLSPIDISSYTCATVYIRAIDIYGNVGFSVSDIIMSDNYKTETFIDSESTNTINVDKACLSDSIFNINFKRKYTKDSSSSIYSRRNKIYLKLVNRLPVGTEIILYDRINNQNYRYVVNSNTNYLDYLNTSENRTYYLLSLADFYKLNNLSEFFDNLVTSYDSSNLFNFDIKMSFKFPDDLAGNSTYKFSDGSAYSTLVDYNPNNGTIVRDSQKIESIIASASDYNPSCSYALNVNNDVATSINNNSSAKTIDIVKTSTNQLIDGVSYNIVSKKDGYKNLKLNVEILDPNNNSLAATVGNNFECKLSYNGGEKIFNTKSNSIASVDLTNLSPLNITSNSIGYNIEFKIINYNFRNIIPNNSYKLKISLISSDGVIGNHSFDIMLDSTRAFSGYSFSSNVNSDERVINHVTGYNNLNNNVLHYNYRYSLYTGEKYLLLKLYKIEDVSGFTTLVDPTEIFTSSTLTSLESNGFYKLGNNACTKDTNCTYPLYFKENIPTGNYYADIFLVDINNVIISNDHFNFIVK